MQISSNPDNIGIQNKFMLFRSYSEDHNNKKVEKNMSMYRSYLLKNQFWARKGNSRPETEKVFIRHDDNGGIYATIIQNGEKKGVKIMAGGQEHFFNNFDKLDLFLNDLAHRQDNFVKILRRKNISQKLRKLDI